MSEKIRGQSSCAVTGAFSYSGKYITRLLLERGCRVITLTGHPENPNPFPGQVEVHPFNFDDPAALTRSLRDVEVLINTYWVRFSHGNNTHEGAVRNTGRLLQAAQDAGVKRMVHVSIAHPSLDSPYEYYRGKAELERAIVGSGISYAILRPTVMFGLEDILINNISWMLRRFPVFGIPGRGDYRIQPAYVGDVAEMVVEQAMRAENVAWDAVGPETYTYKEMVSLLKETIRSHAYLVDLPPSLVIVISALMGRLVGDVVLTGEEVGGLMDNLLISHEPPRCPTRFSEWIRENAEQLGRSYTSELRRHFIEKRR